MAESEAQDQEPLEGQTGAKLVPTKSRRSLSKLRRELTEEELANPITQRFLIEDIDRLERLVTELEGYKERFHEVDKLNTVNEYKLKESHADDIIYGVCLAIGSALLSLVPYFWTYQPAGWILALLGAALIVCGIIAKWKRR